MKKLIGLLCVVLFFITGNLWASYTDIFVDIGDGQKADASFFDASSKNATIFVPGKVFDKSSWHFMALKLQEKNIATLALNGKYASYVTKAIEILKEKGFEHITVVGASMGGTAVLYAMQEVDSSVKKVVLLAPFDGKAVINKSIKKLFIVAKDDSWGSMTYSFYKDSNEQKSLKEYDSDAHAQHLFKTKYKDDLSNVILSFITN